MCICKSIANIDIIVPSGTESHATLILCCCFTNLRHLFEVLVCAEDVTHHKPHPEPFLVAAERLNVQPSACRAYEDADAGIESVHRAGMSAVDVRRLPGHPLFVPPASPAQV